MLFKNMDLNLTTSTRALLGHKKGSRKCLLNDAKKNKNCKMHKLFMYPKKKK